LGEVKANTIFFSFWSQA